jgi:transcriptional activator protein UGA3
LQNFAYHDILASVSLDREPLIPGKYWMSDKDTMVNTYFGLADFPMVMLAEISALNESLKRSSSSSSATETLNVTDNTNNQHQTLNPLSEASRIENALLRWQPAKAQDQSLICLASSYCSAALIHLYRTLRHHGMHSTSALNNKIVREIKTIVEQVNTMPISCLPECTVLFPLFLAGGETNVESDIQATRERMQEMVRYRQLENVRIVLEVLEEVWDVWSRTLPIDLAKPCDGLHALERRGWKLALS